MENCPITGKPCPKTKGYHVTEITENGLKSLNLCQNCVEGYLAATGNVATQIGDFPQQFQPSQSIIEQLINFLKYKSLSLPKPPPVAVEAEQLCEKCETGLSDIFKGRLGCPHCYSQFEAELKKILTNIHGSITHVGKVPRKYREQYEKELAEQFFNHDTTIVASNYAIQQHVVHLQAMLEKAVQEEKYEMAAKCKNAISEIEFLKAQKGIMDTEFMNAALRKDIETAKLAKEQIEQVVDLCLKQRVE